MKESYEELRDLVLGMEKDITAVDEKGNKEQQMVRASLSLMFLHLSIFCEFAQKRGLD